MQRIAYRAASRLAAVGRVALVLGLITTPTWAAPWVSGKVVEPGGEPVAGATVRLVAFESCHARVAREVAGQPRTSLADGRTDDAGRFRIEAPDVGLYQVRIEVSGHPAMSARLTPLIDDVELATAELVAATPLEVVVRRGEAALDGASVRLVRGEASTHWQSRPLWRPAFDPIRTDAEGRARLAIPDGEWLVRAQAPGLAPARHETSGTSRRLVLNLDDEGVDVPVRLVDTRGEPVSDVAVLVDEVPTAVAEDGRTTLRLAADRESTVIRGCAADGGGHAAVDPAAFVDEEGRESAPRPATITIESLATWSGRVLDARDRRGVARALVWPSGRPHRATRTDARGEFTVAAIRLRGVEAAALGYAPGRSIRSFGSTADASPSGEAPTVILSPASSLEGRVVDTEGRPMADLLVTLAPDPSSSRSFRVALLRDEPPHARTDAEGRYRFGLLSSDMPFRLEAKPPGFAPAELAIPSLEPLENRVAPDLVLEPGRRAVGRIVDADETAVVGAAVVLETSAGTENHMAMIYRQIQNRDSAHRATTDAEGRFEIRDLAPGRFRLEATAKGFARVDVPGVEILADSVETDLGTVVLVPGVVLDGRVVDAEGRGVEGAAVQATELSGGMAAMFRGLGDRDASPSATSDADGRFRVVDLRPGRFSLSIGHDGYASTTIDSLSVPTDEPIEVVLERAASLAGRVVDGSGRAIARAQIRVEGEGRSAMRLGDSSAFGVSDPEGHFEIDSIAPGSVAVVAEAEGFRPVRITGIDLAPGASRDDLELVLERGETVEGVVRAADATPVPEAIVMAQRGGLSFDPSARPSVAQTDGDGRYRLEGLSPGRLTVTATSDGLGSVSRPIEVVAGQSHRLDLEFDGGAEVSGYVRDSASGDGIVAQVQLIGQGVPLTTESDLDGRFSFDAVAPGRCTLNVSASGYATETVKDIDVTSAGVSGLDIVLGAGSTVTGQISGLDFDELGGVSIMVMSQSGFYSGEADFEGRFRIENIGVGTWTLRAEAPARGQQLTRQVVIEENQSEVVVDLDFATGFTLTGIVRQHGQGVGGAHVSAERIDGTSPSTAVTEPSGDFRLSGLTAGRYRLRVEALGTGIRHRQNIELVGDEQISIDLRTARVSGSVVDAATGESLSGVELRLEPTVGQGTMTEVLRGFQASVRSDSRGRFHVGDVTAGSWTLRAKKAGWAAIEQRLDIVEGQDLDLPLTLQATDVVRLRLVSPTGPVSGLVHVAIVDPPDNVLVTTSIEADGSGGVELTTIPPGRHEAWISTHSTATVRATFTAPGDAGTITLDPGGEVQVVASALVDDPMAATIRATDANGRAYRQVSWGGQLLPEALPFQRGRTTLRLASGSWTLTIETEDGRRLSGQATVVVGGSTSVTID